MRINDQSSPSFFYASLDPIFFGFFCFPLFEVVGLEIELNVADVGGRSAVPPHGARVPHRVCVHLGRDSTLTSRRVV